MDFPWEPGKPVQDPRDPLILDAGKMPTPIGNQVAGNRCSWMSTTR
jgi:hypothetical protein